MEIKLLTQTEEAFFESGRLYKTIQESVESVVPDTKEDVASIASVQTEVLLKSKEQTGHGVSVVGEVSACVIYIAEGEKTAAGIEMKKQFVMEFDADIGDTDITSQVRLTRSNAAARIINPRKVAVTVEISGELTMFSRGAVTTASTLPENENDKLKVLEEGTQAYLIKAVSERTFSISDVFSIMPGKAMPEKILFGNAMFLPEEGQKIGSKALLKGRAAISVCYMSAELAYPQRMEHKVPFSQIVDLDDESVELIEFSTEPVSMYYDINDTIGGGKEIAVELRALIQLTGRSRKSVSLCRDAYSNIMPVTLERYAEKYTVLSEQRVITAEHSETIELGNGCNDILSVSSQIMNRQINGENVTASVQTEIIYTLEDGTVASARRSFAVESYTGKAVTAISGAMITEESVRAEQTQVSLKIGLAFVCTDEEKREITYISSVSGDEDTMYDIQSFPSLTLTKKGNGTLWELAKEYHSSVEAIRAVNGTEELTGRMLLIPRVK